MQPTTRGRYRVHDRRDPAASGDPAEFVLVELPADPVTPADPGAEDAYEPLYVVAEGYEGALGDDVAALEAGYAVDAELAWADGTARFSEATVTDRSRFHFADDVEGMFEAAVETWREARAAGEAIASRVTRSTDGEPNGALYVFADAPGRDLFAEMRSGSVPIEPLVARVNTEVEADSAEVNAESAVDAAEVNAESAVDAAEVNAESAVDAEAAADAGANSRPESGERAVFVLRPANYRFVAVYVVFEEDGILANTIRDTYDIGAGLASGLEGADDAEAGKPGAAEPASLDDLGIDLDGDDDLRNV